MAKCLRVDLASAQYPALHSWCPLWVGVVPENDAPGKDFATVNILQRKQHRAHGLFHCRPRLIFNQHNPTAARKSFLSRDAYRSCVLFCAIKSAPRVGDIVYVLKPNNMASLGLVRELAHKEKGSKTSWLVLQKRHALDPRTGSPARKQG